MRKGHLILILPGALTFALAACSGGSAPADPPSSIAAEADETEAAAAAVPSSQPQPLALPDALDNADGLQTVAEALKVTGIAGMFAGKGSYTLLAPEDDAFTALGATDKKLIASDDHTALTALMRNHMLIGRVTPGDLGAAIDASKDGKVTMTTLGGNTLVFTRTDQGIAITAPDGSHATLDGDPVTGTSSIAIPISGLLKKLQAPPAFTV
jgi:uncharacterized surface protein with fasciclin (FAS1) repeats